MAKNSLRSYTTALSTFLIYIFKFDRYLMHKSWIRSIKTFTYGIEDERKKFKAMRKTIMVLLKKADANCPPIDFPNYPVRHFIKYCLSLRSSKGQRLSTASYNNKRSALFHLFRMYSVKQSDQFLLELTTLMKGLKREIAEEKQHGNGKIQTGKIPISFALYRRINEFFLKENTMESIFARAFMCLTWNLVCRATNTVTIHLHHLSWADDCLSVFFAHMKNDQTGEKKRDPRHVYANPHDVLVCPITAIAIYLSTFNITGTKDTALFPKNNPSNMTFHLILFSSLTQPLETSYLIVGRCKRIVAYSMVPFSPGVLMFSHVLLQIPLMRKSDQCTPQLNASFPIHIFFPVVIFAELPHSLSHCSLIINLPLTLFYKIRSLHDPDISTSPLHSHMRNYNRNIFSSITSILN